MIVRSGSVPAVVLVSLLATGCGLLGEDEPQATRTVEKTRVEVVEGLGKNDSFDPASIYRRLSPGVVTVSSRFGNGAPSPLDPSGGEQAGLGSGFVVDGEGRILTNAHVVTTGDGARPQRADQVYVEFADGNRAPAEIIGDDPNSDVALLEVDPDGLALTPLTLGSSRGLTVGQPVAAIGSPLGEPQTLTIGVISALDRSIKSLTDYQIGNAIQTDAAINQGNSGGPLLSASGSVLGINSQIKSTSGGSVGLGFAVPADTVKRSFEQLRDNGKVDYAFIGVTTRELYPRLAEHLDVAAKSGALIKEVVPSSPADDAGLKAGSERTSFQGEEDIPRGGDVIVSVEGNALSATEDLVDLISLRDPGERVELEVLRDGDRRKVTVELARRPSGDPSR